jgi:UDPglucose 6-dehydrogenase
VRITVIGTGYLGLTHAVCMADMGHDVLATDSDTSRLQRAAAGEAPFFEPGLEPLLRKNLDAGRLRFTDIPREIAEFGDMHFLCVGTPQSPGSDLADLSYLHAAADTLAAELRRPCLIVGKSTVPVGTARRLRDRIQAVAGPDAELAWNPEFLREGYAVRDTLMPDRIVLGVTGSGAAGLLRQVYAGPLSAGVPALEMNLESAELVKVAANAFLATKISFINMMAQMCEAAGGDVIRLAEALGYDERIGSKFLGPGLGYGGGCLPKDVRALRATAAQIGVGPLVSLLSAVDEINLGRRDRVLELAAEMTGGLAGRRVAVLGISFKPNSDDIRDSPSLAVCRGLAARGAHVSVHDPVAMPNAARAMPSLRCADSVSEAATGADLIMHLTEWHDYRAIDPIALGNVVGSRRLLDARCALDADAWRTAGWQVRSPGRPAPPPRASSVVEVAGSCEIQGDAGGAGGLDHLVVTDRAAGLGDRADAALHQDL